ncbi:MAG: hypothetical protein GWN53_11435 [Gammaproteobacteria bacterium]|nr:hypothetical protein [Gammaproteobacteria bacterium]NIV52475.1 hypothetical protein [Gammaproteobacteria bacterium]NIV75121.1 hypothetical protein [Gammaproteobacteria bacterium]NIW86443.1 hypothetical protein [Gammaproteobacteria bacterium]
MTMGQGMGPGMMGQGMGPGMMGQGMGPGMMGPGQYGRGMGPGMMGPGQYGRGMGPGMMGPGQYGPGTTERGPYGQGMGPGPGMRVVPDRDLSADDVRHFFDHWVQMHGLSGLQVGKVEQKGEDTIVAELTTKDGTLVQRYNVDRHTGAVQPAM